MEERAGEVQRGKTTEGWGQKDDGKCLTEENELKIQGECKWKKQQITQKKKKMGGEELS